VVDDSGEPTEPQEYLLFQNVPDAPISTSSLFGYFSVILLWEWNVTLWLMRGLGKARGDGWLEIVSGVITISLTLFVMLRGRHDFAKWRATGGRVPLTSLQCVLITLLMIAFGCMIAWMAN